MPLSPALAEWLAERGHSAMHAAEIGLSSSSDSEILDRARDEQRVVITADLDYPRLLALAGDRAPGLLLFRGGTFGEQDCLTRLERVLGSIPETDSGHLHHRHRGRANPTPTASHQAAFLAGSERQRKT